MAKKTFSPLDPIDPKTGLPIKDTSVDPLKDTSVDPQTGLPKDAGQVFGEEVAPAPDPVKDAVEAAKTNGVELPEGANPIGADQIQDFLKRQEESKTFPDPISATGGGFFFKGAFLKDQEALDKAKFENLTPEEQKNVSSQKLFEEDLFLTPEQELAKFKKDQERISSEFQTKKSLIQANLESRLAEARERTRRRISGSKTILPGRERAQSTARTQLSAAIERGANRILARQESSIQQSLNALTIAENSLAELQKKERKDFTSQDIRREKLLETDLANAFAKAQKAQAEMDKAEKKKIDDATNQFIGDIGDALADKTDEELLDIAEQNPDIDIDRLISKRDSLKTERFGEEKKDFRETVVQPFIDNNKLIDLDTESLRVLEEKGGYEPGSLAILKLLQQDLEQAKSDEEKIKAQEEIEAHKRKLELRTTTGQRNFETLKALEERGASKELIDEFKQIIGILERSPNEKVQQFKIELKNAGKKKSASASANRAAGNEEAAAGDEIIAAALNENLTLEEFAETISVVFKSTKEVSEGKREELIRGYAKSLNDAAKAAGADILTEEEELGTLPEEDSKIVRGFKAVGSFFGIGEEAKANGEDELTKIADEL